MAEESTPTAGGTEAIEPVALKTKPKHRHRKISPGGRPAGLGVRGVDDDRGGRERVRERDRPHRPLPAR